ncbi:UNVERIFIED_CONTAM: Hydroxylysine kinase [Trichonephila clavipes]
MPSPGFKPRPYSTAVSDDSIHSALNHLSKKGLRVPVPVRNLEGNTWKLETVPLLNEETESCERKKCAIHLLTFLTGIPLQQLKITCDLLFQLGSLLAQFHNATEVRFLHGDFNDLNILAREKSSERNNRMFVIDGILDFEDMHYGNYVWDIGLMLTHVLMGQHDMDVLEAVGHALAGYLSCRSLSDMELSFLKN